ncbi:lipoate--protein ligase family protein [Natronomonas sp. CBA1123]|uniref:lipoate--protein ligase family protein n=1 Tax=Natronomonas sp. CBA1123 TaxID=2668070 RepID=UPI0012EAAE68|nr:lipoate--protein ligase family protein [Natronomonas sp. CBA1123]MUV86303.1 lipoate--protein ligase family protein [Natronomonas sp. CBA1123]
MRVVRGRSGDVNADREVGAALSAGVEATGEPALRVWTPHQQVAFGRRDAASDGYDRARQAARQRDYAVVEREVGGRAVAYTGSVVAFSHVVPNRNGEGIGDRYDDATDRLKRALSSLGATVRDGEPDGAFCPGDHSLQGGGKIAGIAQRVRRETATVGGCIVVRAADESAIADVLTPVYDALGALFDPESVGSVEAAGGPGDPDGVIDAVESAFVGKRRVERVAAEDVLRDV